MTKMFLPRFMTTRENFEKEEEIVECLLEEESSVSREYREAFKSNSFTELWNQVQIRMGRKSLRKSHTLSISLSFSSSTSSNRSPADSSECLLEPLHETLADDIDHSNLHHLVFSYLKATCEARDLCESLLRNTRQVRASYRTIRRVIVLADRVENEQSREHQFYDAMYKELASLSKIRNPVITINPTYFHSFDNGLALLLCSLNTELRRNKRKRALLGRYLTVCIQTDAVERRRAQLEVGAEGVYALVVALGTIGRLVMRLQDETEHNKALADMCVRKGRRGIVMEVVKEFRKNEGCFLEQLKELEDQTYLCFLNITRYMRKLKTVSR